MSSHTRRWPRGAWVAVILQSSLSLKAFSSEALTGSLAMSCGGAGTFR